MKLFFDENFDGEISRRLCRKFPGSIYAGDDERFKGLKNGELFAFLSGKEYVLVSEDKHFLKETVYPAEKTGGIVVVPEKEHEPGRDLQPARATFFRNAAENDQGSTRRHTEKRDEGPDPAGVTGSRPGPDVFATPSDAGRGRRTGRSRSGPIPPSSPVPRTRGDEPRLHEYLGGGDRRSPPTIGES